MPERVTRVLVAFATAGRGGRAALIAEPRAAELRAVAGLARRLLAFAASGGAGPPGQPSARAPRQPDAATP